MNLRGVTANYIQTLTCQTTKERNEDFMDLMLPIKNYQGNKFKSIDESISFMLTPELMEGRDQYDCSVCGHKVDALRGIKFGHLPEVLTLSLMRFDINYSTYERIKINDYYAFDLRLDMAKYSGKADDVYDLYAVMVHRGDAYSGHYHVIIRDVDGLVF
jgi:ubiquitin C-terminal hydrolase